MAWHGHAAWHAMWAFSSHLMQQAALSLLHLVYLSHISSPFPAFLPPFSLLHIKRKTSQILSFWDFLTFGSDGMGWELGICGAVVIQTGT